MEDSELAFTTWQFSVIGDCKGQESQDNSEDFSGLLFVKNENLNQFYC